MPTSKVIFYSTLHSSVGRQFKTFKTKIFWGFWAQNIIKMKREVRRIHWYTAEKEKTNDTKVIKDQTTAFFIILAICQQIIQFRLAFKVKGHKSLEYCCQLFSNTFDIR
jgi:hypothetical protein